MGKVAVETLGCSRRWEETQIQGKEYKIQGNKERRK